MCGITLMPQRAVGITSLGLAGISAVSNRARTKGTQKTNPAQFAQAGLAMKNEPGRGLFASGHGQHLPAFVVAAGRTGHMAGDGGAALRAGFEGGGAPAVRSLTEALTAFGLSAFWIGHVLKGVAISIYRGHSRFRHQLQAFPAPKKTQWH